jgi:hydroxypyruvate reductase
LAELPETPKPGDPVFRRSRYVSVLSNEDAVAAAVNVAASHGWTAECDTTCDDWPLERAADYLLERLRSMPKRPACIVSGGELSCPVTGEGQGGRNQAFVLYCAQRIAGERIAVLSAGTDGIDGNSPAAGAVADGDTLSRSKHNAQLSYQQSDSYTYFVALGDTVMTGPTGNNVRDLRLLLAY